MAKITDLALGQTATKPFSFKRRRLNGEVVDCHVALRILTWQEFDAARINAVRYVDSLDKEKQLGQTREELVKDSETIEVLASSLRDPDKTNEPWATPVELRAILTQHEIGLLAKACEDLQEEVGPIYRTMTAERFHEIYEEVRKHGNADPLVFCDWHTQKNFITTLVAQLETLKMDKSSSSSDSNPSDESRPSETSPAPIPDDSDEYLGLDEDKYEELLARVKADVLLSLKSSGALPANP